MEVPKFNILSLASLFKTIPFTSSSSRNPRLFVFQLESRSMLCCKSLLTFYGIEATLSLEQLKTEFWMLLGKSALNLLGFEFIHYYALSLRLC